LIGAIDNADQVKYVNVSLDESSARTLGADSYLGALVDTGQMLSNIHSGDFNLYSDASNAISAWLDGQTIQFAGAGADPHRRISGSSGQGAGPLASRPIKEALGRPPQTVPADAGCGHPPIPPDWQA
jgi:hypothetical protein